MRRATAPAALLVAMAVACAAPGPSSVPPSPSPAPTPSAGPGIALPDPGRPFDAETLLAAMRDSRRPDGVPDQLETDEIAAALADSIWTFDGRPWDTIVAGGSCGPEACTLELAGSSAGALGDDAWAFEVTPAYASVEPISVELMAFPADVAPQLDDLARNLVPAADVEGMLLANARWLPPPDEGRFVLAYRSGGEEGSCGLDVTLDAVAGVVVEQAPVGC
jgi:hypothetical protein